MPVENSTESNFMCYMNYTVMENIIFRDVMKYSPVVHPKKIVLFMLKDMRTSVQNIPAFTLVSC
jgi:hypothetical protein